MSTKRIGCLVIGAGPGGYVAGIRLGQLGVETVVVERDRPGGVCLNVGCIPSKALIHVAEQVEWLRREARVQGVMAEDVRVDAKVLQRWKAGIVRRLTRGVGHLLEKNGVEYVEGTATFVGPHAVEVTTAEGPRRFEPEHVIVATGSRAIQIPGFPFTHDRVLSSREALDLEEVPDDLLIVGGGVIGLELGTAYARLGSKLTVVEALDTVLPGMDPDLVQPVVRGLKRRKAKIHTLSKATGFEEQDDGRLLVHVETPGGDEEVPADKVLVSVGMVPNSEGLGLDAAGVRTDARGYLAVDGGCRTHVPHVLAVGDVTGPPLLAHRASRMGEVAAEVVAGRRVSMDDVVAMPAAVYTAPEIATVGLSEAEAEAEGHEVVVGRFPFVANGRALTLGDSAGLVKVVGDATTDALLGVGITGPAASELIGEAAHALEMDATLADLALTVHAHPTLSEALMEAAKAARGEAIHVLNERPEAGQAGS